MPGGTDAGRPSHAPRFRMPYRHHAPTLDGESAVEQIPRNRRRHRVDIYEMPPLAYLITFRCYATWLPGDARGCSDRGHRAPGMPRSAPCLPLRAATVRRLEHPPFALDAAARATVDAAIRDHCDHAGWVLHAVNVRTNHVHVVLSGAAPPERMMGQMKSWATRRLVEAGVIARGTRPWSRHGSTRYLWTADGVGAACRYVVEQQGAVLAGA
jgi:REP element-mobilizing transposase RayT